MPYLKVESGGSVTVVVVDGLMRQRSIHWVGNRSQDCPGEDCQLCEMEIAVKERYQLDVEKSGEEMVWEFSNTVRQQLVGLVGDVKNVAGKPIRIKRIGKGLQTQYLLAVVGEGEEQAPGEVTYITPEVSVILKALDAVICDQRFADLLSECLGG